MRPNGIVPLAVKCVGPQADGGELCVDAVRVGAGHGRAGEVVDLHPVRGLPRAPLTPGVPVGAQQFLLLRVHRNDGPFPGERLPDLIVDEPELRIPVRVPIALRLPQTLAAPRLSSSAPGSGGRPSTWSATRSRRMPVRPRTRGRALSSRASSLEPPSACVSRAPGSPPTASRGGQGEPKGKGRRHHGVHGREDGGFRPMPIASVTTAAAAGTGFRTMVRSANTGSPRRPP